MLLAVRVGVWICILLRHKAIIHIHVFFACIGVIVRGRHYIFLFLKPELQTVS